MATRTGARKGRSLGWELAVAACFLAAGRMAKAQQSEGRIDVTSPERDVGIYAGESIVVAFNASGDAIFGPYDIDLFKGNNEVQQWCSSSAGCDISTVAVDGYALVPVNVSATHEPGLGYVVKVRDRNSSISGQSYPFRMFAALPPNSTEEASAEYRDEVGGVGGVGDMGLGLLVVASICGLALACTLLAACGVMCRRRATKKIKNLKATQDLEVGSGSLDRTTPGRMNDSSSSESRGFSSGQPVKIGAATHGQYTPARVGRADSSSHIYPSPGRAMAMGEHQRGRSLSRSSPGPQMYSTTPGRRRTTSASPARSGSKRMYGGTPGRGGVVVAAMPGRDGSRGGRQMYDHSIGPSWDEPGRRTSSQSPSPGLVRSKSLSRARRPPRSALQEFAGEYSRGNGGPGTSTPGRPHSYGGGRQDPGVRRSKSERHEYSPSHRWAREEEDEDRHWEHRDVMAAVEGMGRGRRRTLSHHSGVSSSGRSKSSHSVRSVSPGQLPERSASTKSRSRSNTPSGQRAYNSATTANGVEIAPDVSWEELRSTYLKDKAIKSKRGVRKSYSLPSYGDAVGDNRPPPPSYSPNDAANSKGLSIGIPDDPKPGSFRGSKSARGARHTILSGPLGSSRTSSSKSAGHFGVSPGARAVNARKAARDAQLSAERALAAAAMASRAADLAAQAALEAEAEADAELIGGDSYDKAEVEVSPPSKSSLSGGDVIGEAETSVREKIKVFSSIGSAERTPGRSPFGAPRARGWSQADDKEVRARAEQSSSKGKKALASFARSSSGGGRPDNSWVKENVRGPDTAGGSSHYGKADAVPEPVALHSDPEELAVKRKAFVKQYSQSATSDANDDSDYSLHDNAAAVAIAAIIGKKQAAVSNGQGHEDTAGVGHTPQVGDAKIPGTPKRGRSTNRDLDGTDCDERMRVRMRPSPGPSHTVTKEVHVHTVAGSSLLNISDSGSPRAEV
eukprot:g7038.t1